ncbi:MULTISPECIES: hypothetical protein [Haloferax]|uniref:Uncharacterized protein n=2 Tax=Haloferax gibbonsii TaxID=35746 RepID=A0A0K1IZB6_HALGI|nr:MULTISPECIES: hypothetical protein [Haloferax]AKU09660.1 hypothetical protein ABY42_17800 [Haloferax gibbonsii]ELZ75845.1 hypothetical protein C454_19354 [Haloferax gibbonsii ATCC 33959]QOS14035.1 uncharacterized protein HfgLR_24250 [Haloferax gibbonsii]RDZ50752.1 hypothetical protein C5C07_18205 [Haloferax sp. Atlit-4N]REA01581.1 hypothetical protein DEQ92_16930 [Haloferax sp. Atlit-6N]
MVSERSTGQDPETTTTDDDVGRRKYLALCGSVSAAGALAGFSGLGSATEQADEPVDDDGHTLVVAGTGPVSSFEVTVSGSISPLQSNGALSTTGTVGPAAEGTVDDDSRRYQFAGDITNFQSTDAVSVYVDGVRIPNDSF